MIYRSIRSLILTALITLTALATMPAGAQEATPAGCPPLSPEVIRARAQQFVDAVNAEDVDLLDEVLHENYQHHWGTGLDVLSREGYLTTMSNLFDTFDNFSFTVEEIFVGDDFAVLRIAVSGTQVTEFNGFPASDQPTSWAGIQILEFDECGQILETWSEFDHLGRLIRQGLVVRPLATPAP